MTKTEGKIENSNTTIDKDRGQVLQLQLQSYHHLQTMARGWLSLILGLLVLTLTALSIFYVPIPSVPTEPHEYETVVNGMFIPIGSATAAFTGTIGIVLSFIFLSFMTISLYISINNFFSVSIPDENTFSEIVENSREPVISMISENGELISQYRDMYTTASLRLILAMIFGINVFLIYNWAVSQNVLYLFSLSLFYVTSGTYISLNLIGVLGKPAKKEQTKNHRTTIFNELLRGKGARFELLKERNVERWMTYIITACAYLIIAAWTLSIIFNLIVRHAA